MKTPAFQRRRGKRRTRFLKLATFGGSATSQTSSPSSAASFCYFAFLTLRIDDAGKHLANNFVDTGGFQAFPNLLRIPPVRAPASVTPFHSQFSFFDFFFLPSTCGAASCRESSPTLVDDELRSVFATLGDRFSPRFAKRRVRSFRDFFKNERRLSRRETDVRWARVASRSALTARPVCRAQDERAVNR